MFRIGNGYDVHKLVEGRKLILGGVEIPHPLGLDGHSDADALCHALCDALLGACSAGDIGHYFPPSDSQWKNISSLVLLEKVGQVCVDRQFKICNIDSVIVAQQPKLAPHIDKMKNNLASTLGIDADRVNVKATTTEGLGLTGQEQGIAAYAVALLERLE
ncbi:MAG: 2-C-methyl-D-erythritol 2,4-cyclodiphosphate synthase [Nitrospinales bacterium]